MHMNNTSVNSGGLLSFPHQKRSRAQKNDKFYKDCVEAADMIVGFDNDNGFRALMKDKVSNYNLINNIVDPEEVKRAINPYNIEAEFTANYKNYPLINSYMAVLTGEERQMRFNPIVNMTSPDLINSKLEEMTATLNQNIIEMVVSKAFSEEDAQAKIQGQSKWMKFNYRDRRERMASQIINYGFQSLGLKEMFSRNFEDLLISAEEIAITDILGGEPVVRKGNPLGIYTIRSGDSYKIEDSEIIIELSYSPVGQVIDDYHDELSSKDIKTLEEGFTLNSSISNSMFTRNLKNHPINLDTWINNQGGIGTVIEANSRQSAFLGGAYDSFGNIRKMRVVWKGMRKVGVLKYLDDEGDLQKQYIDEDYPLSDDEKEQVNWIWIGEWNEATKLGDDIFVKMGPRPVQFRSLDNPSKCSSGIVGNIFNVNTSKALSFVGLTKDFQLTYNYFMHKLWEEMKTFKGKVARVNMNLIPSQFTMDQFLFYIDQLKIAFEDPFNEGQKGAAQGKLAGNLGQNSGSYDFGDIQVIQNLLAVLSFLENRIQEVSGITPQRKGAIGSRETVGGVERSVHQSSLNTAKEFGVHDDFRVRVLTTYLETAKVAWKDQKFKRQFIMDDGSQAVLDFDSEMFIESEYGVFVTNSVQDQEMFQNLKQLVQPFMQNGGTFSMIMELYRSQDPASLQRKFEAFEDQLRQEGSQAQKAAQEAQNAAMQSQMQLEQAKLEIEQSKVQMDKYIADLDSETQIQKAMISRKEEFPEEDLSQEELDLKRRQLDEVVRKNKKLEEIKERELTIKKSAAKRQ